MSEIDLGSGIGCTYYKQQPVRLNARGLTLWLASADFYMPMADQKQAYATTMQNGCKNLSETYIASVTFIETDYSQVQAGDVLTLFVPPVLFQAVTGTVKFLVLTFSDGDKEILWAQDLSYANATLICAGEDITLYGAGQTDFPLLCHERIN